jgi:hypothetical protein
MRFRIPFKVFSLLFALIISLSAFAAVHAQATEQDMINIVADSEEFADWLAQYPNWVGHAYGPDNGVWYVEFYDETEEEWLGYANVNEETGEFQDFFAPRPLPADQYQAELEKVQPLVLADPEILGRLVDPVLWDVETDFNRYEAQWEVRFYRGIEAMIARVRVDGDYITISEIFDPNELEEEEALEEARNEAISLAYGGEGIDAALDGHDNWETYTENQAGSIWSVTFAADDEALYFALIDVSSDAILEAHEL